MPDDLTREEVVSVLDQIIEGLLEKAGISQPPVDAIALAQQHLGMTVVLDSRQPERGRIQRAGRKPQIFLRPEPTEERHQWTVALEIGHHLREQIHGQLNLTEEEAKNLTGESLRTLFSSRLLVPTVFFVADAKATKNDLLALKKRYPTASHEVISLRFLDLPFPTVVTIVDNDHIHRRKSNGPKITQEMEAIEKKCQQYVNRYSRTRTMTEGNWSVQGWPVHQSDWKREILRSVVDE